MKHLHTYENFSEKSLIMVNWVAEDEVLNAINSLKKRDIEYYLYKRKTPERECFDYAVIFDANKLKEDSNIKLKTNWFLNAERGIGEGIYIDSFMYQPVFYTEDGDFRRTLSKMKDITNNEDIMQNLKIKNASKKFGL